jgi:hypothetical protein
MTILLISICLMALIRYGMSHRRKKQKDHEIEDEQRIISSGKNSQKFFNLSSKNSSVPKFPLQPFVSAISGWSRHRLGFASSAHQPGRPAQLLYLSAQKSQHGSLHLNAQLHTSCPFCVQTTILILANI